MARKSKASDSNGATVRSPSPDAISDRPTGPLSTTIPVTERDIVKVNNANLTELKNACDDALKRVSSLSGNKSVLLAHCRVQYLSRPELFKQIYWHTDIRLGLGWLSVFVAAGTALYGYKIEFEKSKPVVSIGLILYVGLPSIRPFIAQQPM